MSNIDKEHLINARLRCGYSQKYVALSIGVAASTVSQWENGAKNPSRENIGKLADLYGVTSDYLIGRDGDSQLKKPVVHTDDELDLQLLSLIHALPPEKKKFLLELLQGK